MADISAAGSPRKMMAQVYSAKQACRHAKITHQQFIAWHRAGLVESPELFEYRHILTLRALAGMKQAGLRGRKLREALAWLAAKLDESGDALDQVRVTRRGRRTIIRLPGQEVELWSGQLQLNFEAPTAVPLAARQTETDERRRKAQAELHFQRGLELEQQGAPVDQIIEAYRQAADLDSKSAGAFVNLGTIYFNARMWRESEKYYLAALAADHNYPLAHFNLANLYDERGDRGKALDHYESALQLKPGYADAHYNLALLCQSIGQTMKALKHWRMYLKLDPGSSWATIARRELKKLQDSALVEGKSNAS